MACSAASMPGSPARPVSSAPALARRSGEGLLGRLNAGVAGAAGQFGPGFGEAVLRGRKGRACAVTGGTPTAGFEQSKACGPRPLGEVHVAGKAEISGIAAGAVGD